MFRSVGVTDTSKRLLDSQRRHGGTVKECITKQQQYKQEKLVLNRQWEKHCVVTAVLVDLTKRSMRSLSQQLCPVPVWLLDPSFIPVLFSFLAHSQTLLLKFVSFLLSRSAQHQSLV